MTLRRKLLLAQLPLALSLVVVGITSRKTITALDRNSQAILKDNHQSVLAAQRMRDAAELLGRATLHGAPADAAQARARATFERELRFQESNITEAGERDVTERLRAAWTHFVAAGDDASLVTIERSSAPSSSSTRTRWFARARARARAPSACRRRWWP